MNQHANWQPPEPPWMEEYRNIQREIARQVELYISKRNGFLMWLFFCSLGGYWLGFGTVELFKWIGHIQ